MKKKFFFQPLNRKRSSLTVTGLLIALFAAALFFLIPERTPYASVARTMENLKQIRDRKQAYLESHFKKIERMTTALAQAPRTLEAFLKLKGSFHGHGPQSLEYSKVEAGYRAEFKELIAQNDYYDLFLIDASGVIVYTVKKEDDFGGNVLQGEYVGTPISECFLNASSRGVGFATYDYYDPSNDVAAFSGAAIKGPSGETLGVLAIQLSVQNINSVLTDYKGLGHTGESYLVDRKYRMLTDSRFFEKSTILNVLVDTRAARKALRGEIGCDIIEDYRGVTVLSSYSFIEVGEVRWAILVEIDQDEVIMSLSGPEKEALFTDIVERLDNTPLYQRIKPAPKPGEAHYTSIKGKKILVKVGEVQRAGPGEVLFTAGVATCTAVTVGGAGHHGYMAHLSPVDMSYGLDVFTRKLWLRGRSTDLIGDMLREIMQRVEPEKIEDLKVGIFAVQTKSLKHTMARLVEYGIRPSQIRLVYGPKNGSLTIFYDHASGATYIRWDSLDDTKRMDLNADLFKETKSIEEIAEEIFKQKVQNLS